MRIVCALFMGLFLAFCTGCTQKPSSLPPEQYLQWISTKENGLYKIKALSDVEIKVRHLPADYLGYQEFKSSETTSLDSLINSYACGLTFQITLQADKASRSHGNLLYYGVADENEFVARTRALSFNIDQFVRLTMDGNVYQPVLAQYEGYDAMSNRISFQVVFNIDEYNCGKGNEKFTDLTLVVDDPFWDLGVNNFLFEKNNLINIPKLSL